jgi:hypothetical protein
MQRNKMGTLLLGALSLLMAWTGCSSNKPKAAAQDPDALRKYVSTSSGWVSDKLTAAGVTLGSPHETLANFVKQENYRVCRAIGDQYLHALVPNSKIHPGEQDIHVVALFGSDGKLQQLDVTTQTFSVSDLNKECP